MKSNENATDDTPAQRDDKADVLAMEMRRFQWEVRFYILGLMVFIALKEIFS